MNKLKKHSKLWIYFTVIVFTTVLVVFFAVSGIWMLLFKCGVISVNPLISRIPIVVFCMGSLLLGITIAVFVGKIIIVPVQNISNAFDELSKGNFSVRVPENSRIDEIREMSHHFNTMASDLSQIETLQNDFVVNVSHEFKTPISAIEGYATLLQDPNLSDSNKDRYIRKILDNSHKLSTLSGNILMLSKLENTHTLPGLMEYRLDEQIRRTILSLENKWAEKDIEFELDLPAKMYLGCEQLLEQVWTNILDNAIKHSHNGGKICVRLEEKEEHITVDITDFGDGMSGDVQKHIFEKFYQGDTSRSAEGNGLGLALVKRILDLCGDTVEVESTPDTETTFSVTLHLATQT